MKKISLFLIFASTFLTILSPPLVRAQTPQSLAKQLPENTEIVMATAINLLASEVSEGQTVALKCRENVPGTDGQMLVPAGATGKGRVRSIRPVSEAEAVAVEVEALEVLARDGSRIALEGAALFEGVVTGDPFLEVGEGALIFAKSVGDTTQTPPINSNSAGRPSNEDSEVHLENDPIPVAETSADPESTVSETPASEQPESRQPSEKTEASEENEVPTKTESSEEPAEESKESAETPNFLPADTELSLEMDDEIVPAQAKIGQIIQLRVVDEIELGGHVCFRERARAEGRIKHMNGNSIFVEAISAEAADGHIVPLMSKSIKIEFDPEEAEEMLDLEEELTALTRQDWRLGRK